MKKIALILILLALTGGFYFSPKIKNFIKNSLPSSELIRAKLSNLFDQKVKEPALEVINKQIDSAVQKAAEIVATETKKATEKIVVVPPLIKKESVNNSIALTRFGVLTWTNIERSQAANLPTLRASSDLNLVAQARLEDMFANQYFDHNSPTGKNASFEAKRVNYEYIVIGENIALGNFENDQKLVEAWMNSPGHRANILNPKFSEIGIAAGEGVFDGTKRWIAVQIFAKPQAECPQVSEMLKLSISNNRDQIDLLQSQALSMRDELAQSEPKTKSEAVEYNQKVDQYNAMVNQINQLIEETKSQISDYNNQVGAFNLCAQG